MPWGAAIAAVGAYASSQNASSAASANAQAAQDMANKDLGYTSPYNLNTGFGNTWAQSNGTINQMGGTLNPQYQGLEQGMLGSAGGFLGSLDQMGANGGFSPFLQNAYSQYQNSLPSAVPYGFGSLSNTAFGNTGTAGAFSGAAQGLLGSLGNFNPAQAGQNYTNLLAQQSAPGNALAAQNLTQNLFNSGALGATGGANALGALGQMQGQQYVAQQMAGQQLGMQQQSMLGGLASQFGGLGNQINATNYGMGSGLAGTLFGNQYQLGQQGFQNALGLNQAGLQNLGGYSSLASSMLGGGMGIDSALLQQMQAAAGMGAERTGAANNATGTALQGQLALNNTNAAGTQGLIDAFTNANWSGLFGGNTGNSDTANPYVS